MLVIGLTGSFGTGKTTVAKFFKHLGAYVIDADKISRYFLKTNSPTYKNIIRNFGKEVLKNNSWEIDRHKLGGIVFENNKLLKKLNNITHPAIINQIKKDIARLSREKTNKIIVIDAPLLIEAGLLGLVDKLVVVTASKDTQVRRIRKSKCLSVREIGLRIKSQLPLKKKIKSADYIIDNNGSLTYTKKQVKMIWEEIRKMNLPLA